ncbi:MAG TPA: AGE family epimerase/isomerase [Vicinamibacterales bacterium]|nr:AGE family epimerase/isomerase [Vicinamibacterales bacterium]
MNEMRFTFSDSIAGYIASAEPAEGRFVLTTSDGRNFTVNLTDTTSAELLRNLNEPYADATGLIAQLLDRGRHVFAYGVFYPEADGHAFEAKRLVFVGRSVGQYQFEKQDWWTTQVGALGDSYLKWQFGTGPVDYREYRTVLNLAGEKRGDHRQETDTISRLVYGFASAYLMTGEDRYLDGATRGTQYLRDHMRFVDKEEDIVYWYHGIDVEGAKETKIFASEFGDDYDAIPMYEQIYALAGPTQTYRITGDPRILSDIEATIRLFDRYYLDRRKGGYFSHLDPITMDPRSPSLGRNAGRKNWNSVGDHAPAYLINAYLATGEQRLADFLTYTGDTVEQYFPDYTNSPFVNERFNEDWSLDQSWGWQQNRAVVGHNLKIAWNLMRLHHLKPNARFVALARKIGDLMPSVGSDRQRGGWYDVMSRTRAPGQEFHRFTWHDRKAWWQQEQAILAYLILAGSLGDETCLKHGREAAAFYNAFFLDHDDGGVYFNVLASGVPYLVGNERFKGSHSMSNYHASELCYLAAVYSNLLITRQPMDFHFKPQPGGFKHGTLRVAPDLLPPGSVRIGGVLADGEPYHDFDADGLTVKVPDSKEAVRLKVTLVPTKAPD